MDRQLEGQLGPLGIQQTPFIDYEEGIYRYRFQGTVFAEREGAFASADAGVSFHSNIPNNYGDFHVGIYNGEDYNRAKPTIRRRSMVRGTFRPFADGKLEARGLRITGFWDNDAPSKGGRSNRAIFKTTYEHKPTSTSASSIMNQNDQAQGPRRRRRRQRQGLVVLRDAVLQGEGQRPRSAVPLRRYKANKNIDATEPDDRRLRLLVPASGRQRDRRIAARLRAADGDRARPNTL